MARTFSKIPIFGWLCRTSGHVMVDGNDKNTTKPAVNLAVKTMEDGCSLIVYPESKRSFNSHDLLPFKTGAFRIAQKTGVPILPVVIKGTNRGMKMWGICKPADLELIIGEPIIVEKGDTEDESWDMVVKTSDKTRDFIQKHLSDRY